MMISLGPLHSSFFGFSSFLFLFCVDLFEVFVCLFFCVSFVFVCVCVLSCGRGHEQPKKKKGGDEE
jgi:hypothetical protein